MDAILCKYRNERRKFYARHGARWPGTLADEFDILAPRPLSRAEADEILNATASLARIYDRAAQLLRRVSDQALLEMGVPRYLLPAVRCAIPGMTDCVVGRFDLARTEHGYKLLEFNADVAGLLVEAFSINPEVCRDAGNEDPNESGERDLVYALTKAVEAGLKYVGKRGTDQANVVVTSCGRCIRDVALAEYLCRLLEAFPARYSPIESLSIDAEGLYDPGEIASMCSIVRSPCDSSAMRCSVREKHRCIHRWADQCCALSSDNSWPSSTHLSHFYWRTRRFRR